MLIAATILAIPSDSSNFCRYKGGTLETAVDHAVKVHGHEDTPGLRKQLTSGFKEGTPPA